MRLFLILCTAYILSTISATGNNVMPLQLDNSTEYYLKDNFEIYLDSSNTHSLSQIIQKYSEGKFLYTNNGKITIEPFKTYWVRFELTNTCSNELMWMLHTNAQISHVWVYPFVESPLHMQPVFTDSSRAVLYYISDNRILLPVYTNARNIYYVKLYNHLNIPVSISQMYLSSSAGYKHYWLTHGLYVGILLGGLFVMVMYALLSFIRKPQSVFLNYFLYIFLILLYNILSTFIGGLYIFTNNPMLCYSCNIVMLIAFYFYFPFIRKMTINEHNTKVDRRLFKPFIIFMYINSGIVSVIAFINESLFKTLLDISLSLYGFAAILLIVTLWRTNQKMGRIILVGMACMVAGGLATVVYGTIDNIEENYFFSIGVFAELLVFTYVINELQKQMEADNKHKEVALLDARYRLENKQRELTQKALHITQQEEILGTIKNQLLEIKGEKAQTNEIVLNMLSDVDIHLKQNSWEDFEMYFTKVHPEFYDKLKAIYPDLTQYEIRVCAMLKLNLNTKQIAEVFRKSPKSIEVARTRIRQKIGLTRDENLFDTLSHV